MRIVIGVALMLLFFALAFLRSQKPDSSPLEPVLWSAIGVISLAQQIQDHRKPYAINGEPGNPNGR